jgi:hypothetical protein
MKQTINEYQFKRAFETTRPNNFSYEGLTALYEYLEQYEEETGQEMELDVIGLCCEFTEYDSLKEFQQEYYEDEPKDSYKTIDEIENETIVIRIEGKEGFIIQDF